ncbi:MAG: leucyl aminopeptidase [Rhizobiales bacterium 65-9]|nr:leucyl aminopeptidase [Hyphomicrobiales bacterium]OJY37644.1 MAG: leucyl aminopeptidase [Rhizobiales bacterium 65-9]
MSRTVQIAVAAIPSKASGVLVLLCDEALDLAESARKLIGPDGEATFRRAAAIESFKGKANAVLSIAAPAGTSLDRLVVVGMGPAAETGAQAAAALGGAIAGALAKAKAATVILDRANGPLGAEAAADAALGAMLRAYAFDRYKTKKKGDEADAPTSLKLTLGVADPAAVRKALPAKEAVAQGVILARDLVNEPPNVLDPPTFANRVKDLKKVGVEVEVLGEKELARIGAGALLGVGRGSEKETQLVVMRWNGAKNAGAPPVAFVGKGVTFDTGGISIKPAGGMEDMKGDMAGAACVTGLMHALASRKAKVNAVGVIGLVENMPGGSAQRPGDIVTSLSGQTIEIINTDAEGRLLLADALWYVQDRFKPAFMIDLATLTGACVVALGKEYAGLFSNNDELSERLHKAGQETGDRVWRLPLAPEYDKMMDSRFADVKNSGGREAGAITAAQFLQRFVNKTAWAHLDIAGTAMGSPKTEISQGWSSGFGVRLLDRLVASYYER